jgi:hypothetical protein
MQRLTHRLQWIWRLIYRETATLIILFTSKPKMFCKTLIGMPMTLTEASDYSRAAAHPSVFGILHCSLHKGDTVLHSM